ncbi:MAG: glutamine--fructose-6-phosphate transaminase (isomerizing) [Clostridia bacterium]|nr:glutamine--fructose-6-phosphate transaminase (isomerizing) [Clostridia bacterium]
MCGITGYTGKRQAAEIILENLKRLEYRGYDSSGIAVSWGNAVAVRKTEGRVERLEEICRENPVRGTCGIGHTRWATHGKADTVNAHPHTTPDGAVAVVHNGIIDNYRGLRSFLESKGYRFVSETDTEVIPNLVDYYYRICYDFLGAVQCAVAEFEGSFAIGVICSDSPGKIIAVSKRSPLVIGAGDDGNYISSDINTLPEDIKKVYVLEDGEIAVVTADGVSVFGKDGKATEKRWVRVSHASLTNSMGEYPHYMLKEIYQQPHILHNIISSHVEDGKVVSFADMKWSDISDIQKVFIIGCGTSYNAARIGKIVVERYGRISVEADISSEFRYRAPVINDKTFVVAITQSGETADTLSAMTMAKERGAKVVVITNTPSGTASRIADYTFLTEAGPEISVASTKAYTAQLAALYIFALFLGEHNKITECSELRTALSNVAKDVTTALSFADEVKELAENLACKEHLFYIGRGLDSVTCSEGALKMKEITYIHADSYPAGELKHGPIALIDKGTPVIAVSTDSEVHSKLCANISEVSSRGADVVCITPFDAPKDCISIEIPETYSSVSPFVSIIPLQLLAYYTAVYKGCDVDKPRNLAKSVTVE